MWAMHGMDASPTMVASCYASVMLRSSSFLLLSLLIGCKPKGITDGPSMSLSTEGLDFGDVPIDTSLRVYADDIMYHPGARRVRVGVQAS